MRFIFILALMITSTFSYAESKDCSVSGESNWEVVGPSTPDKRKAMCPYSTHAVQYKGYLATVCLPNETKAKEELRDLMGRIKQFEQSDCQILLPTHQEAYSRSCPRGAFGVTIKGAFLDSQSCFYGLSEAIKKLENTPVCYKNGNVRQCDNDWQI